MNKLKITIYTDQASIFSVQAREWLKSRNFSFEEKDVSEEKNLEELVKITEQYAVPVIVIGKTIIFGFDEKKLEEALLK